MIFVCVKFWYLYLYKFSFLILEIEIVKSDKDLIKHGEIMWSGY